jgi:propionyl-CoA synthetase
VKLKKVLQATANVAEVAVVGVADDSKGQVAMAFAIPKDVSKCCWIRKIK